MILTFGKFWFYHPITTLQIDCIKCFSIATASIETEIRKSMIRIISTTHFSWLFISNSWLLNCLCDSSVSCHLIHCCLRIYGRFSLTSLCLRLNFGLNWGWITFKWWIIISRSCSWKCGFFGIWKNKTYDMKIIFRFCLKVVDFCLGHRCWVKIVDKGSKI